MCELSIALLSICLPSMFGLFKHMSGRGKTSPPRSLLSSRQNLWRLLQNRVMPRSHDTSSSATLTALETRKGGQLTSSQHTGPLSIATSTSNTETKRDVESQCILAPTLSGNQEHDAWQSMPVSRFLVTSEPNGSPRIVLNSLAKGKILGL